ncbi:MarR family winged helix-turn-helix transcriptional regulator [Paenibacillus xylaniclasticus]|uniref:MarR family winged helix-turn-helix transcriptional regulator n=1 Tax=Paenibacillus xylaniclasticus TaxID=588083 RepID=UPI000FDB6849|nr:MULTISPECIES: MarR family transcriptional regulator [Paenibacillus]GFN32904.1 MarR family transcriptional regulator [Paenibacillus curdlanolyticus]
MRPEESIGYLIVNTGRKLSSSLTQLFQSYQLTSEQWSLLLTLHHEDNISQKELADRTEKDPANVTRILDQLERKGFVTRQPNPEDRRSYLMHITPVGRKAAVDLIPVENRFMAEVLAGIPEAELEAFRTFIGKVNRNMERRRELRE